MKAGKVSVDTLLLTAYSWFLLRIDLHVKACYEWPVITRLRQDAPCGSTGRNGDRRPRRSPEGEDGFTSPQRCDGGWLRRSSAWLCHRCPARERGELHVCPAWVTV